MSNFFKRLFESNEDVSLEKVVFSLFSITIIRAFFENFSSPNQTGYFFSWRDTYLEFPIYYTSVFLSFALLTHIFSKKSLAKIVNFEIKIFLFALLPPIVDLLITKGQGLPMGYLFIEPQNLFSAFFQTMNPAGFQGITPGIHVAAYLILLSIAIFIYRATGKLTRAILSSFLGYIILFLYAIIPSIVALPLFFQNGSVSIFASYETTLLQSWISTTREHSSGSLQLFQSVTANTFQNETTTQVIFLLLIFQIGLFSYIFRPFFSKEIIKNFRPERIIYWFIISIIGIILSQKINGDINISNTINIISLAIFFILIILNTLLAVCVNDAEDIAIDEISNPNRPLAKKAITNIEWRNLQFTLLILIIIGTAIMNHAVAFLLILAQVAYYIYSAKPLRLKSHFVSSSILIGVSSVAIAMAGFFLTSPNQRISAFPVKAIFLIGISYAILSNLKDIKDFEGDRHEKIKTMPVVFGLESSKRIIAILSAIVLISIPMMIKTTLMIFPSVLISFFMYYLFTKKEYQEKYIFLTLFLYAATLFIVTI